MRFVLLVSNRQLRFYHVLGDRNASDLLTKFYCGRLLQKNSMCLLGTLTTMDSDFACIDQFCQDDILMIRFDD